MAEKAEKAEKTEVAQTKEEEAVFGLRGFYTNAKCLHLAVPASGVNLSVDWDDVDHLETARTLERMCRILNAHWNAPTFAAPMTAPNAADLTSDAEYEPGYSEAKRIMEGLIL